MSEMAFISEIVGENLLRKTTKEVIENENRKKNDAAQIPQ